MLSCVVYMFGRGCPAIPRPGLHKGHACARVFPTSPYSRDAVGTLKDAQGPTRENPRPCSGHNKGGATSSQTGKGRVCTTPQTHGMTSLLANSCTPSCKW
jgi:hypothetical protein